MNWCYFILYYILCWLCYSNQTNNCFPNNKPWVTKDLKTVLNKKNRVFFQGTTEQKTKTSK